MLLSSDINAALFFAKRSLAFPVNLALPIFLYRLAEVNQGAADNLYREALLTHRQKFMNEFLYLSAYPFGNSRDAGDMPSFAHYRVGPSFVPNNSLQRLFAQTLLGRVQQTIGGSTVISPDQFADISQMWLALTRLEGQIQRRLPDLFAAAQEGRAQLFILLSQDVQRKVQENINEQTPVPKASFDEQVEMAQKEPDTEQRDRILVFAIIGASEKESLEQVLTASDKISDSKLREQLLDWLYFSRTQMAIKDKRIDDARNLVTKVQELDQRAYLSSEIAREWLTNGVDQIQAREILDEVVTVALKAPKTIVTARTLLAVGYLYIKIDLNRAKSVFADAVRSINRIESPDFSSQVIIRRIAGKDFGTYAVFQTPGFDPENGFRELAKLDLDDALSQAVQLNDKSLRALTTLAVYEVCLQRSQPQRKSPARRAKG